MSAQLITVIVMLVGVVGWVGWDVYAAFFNDEPRDTISQILRHASRDVVVFPYVWGVLAGHFWGPSIRPPSPWLAVGALVAMAVVLQVQHSTHSFGAGDWVFALVAGTILGAALWPQ